MTVEELQAQLLKASSTINPFNSDYHGSHGAGLINANTFLVVNNSSTYAHIAHISKKELPDNANGTINAGESFTIDVSMRGDSLNAGLGLNYTVFFEETTNDNLNNTLAGLPGVTSALGTSDISTSLDLDSSFGLAYQLGMDWNINENWSANVAVWKINIETDATLSINEGAVTQDIDVTIDPLVAMIGAAYKF